VVYYGKRRQGTTEERTDHTEFIRLTKSQKQKHKDNAEDRPSKRNKNQVQTQQKNQVKRNKKSSQTRKKIQVQTQQKIQVQTQQKIQVKRTH
jgi:hypothetical protein